MNYVTVIKKILKLSFILKKKGFPILSSFIFKKFKVGSNTHVHEYVGFSLDTCYIFGFVKDKERYARKINNELHGPWNFEDY